MRARRCSLSHGTRRRWALSRTTTAPFSSQSTLRRRISGRRLSASRRMGRRRRQRRSRRPCRPSNASRGSRRATRRLRPWTAPPLSRHGWSRRRATATLMSAAATRSCRTLLRATRSRRDGRHSRRVLAGHNLRLLPPFRRSSRLLLLRRPHPSLSRRLPHCVSTLPRSERLLTSATAASVRARRSAGGTRTTAAPPSAHGGRGPIPQPRPGCRPLEAVVRLPALLLRRRR